MSRKQKFVLNCEFELFGDNSRNVVTTCQQLNIHTEDDSIQGAMKKLAEAVVFFFDTAENRHELDAVIVQLASDKTTGL